MAYLRLREIRDRLLIKGNLTKEEQELLDELNSLEELKSLDIKKFSLATASTVCSACGQSLSK